MKFDQNDQRCWEAAAGWLELGDWQDAHTELEEISPKMRAHPDVLKLRVAIHCAARRFDLAATVSDTPADALAKDAQFWLNRAVALCQLGRWRDAEAAILICFALNPHLRVAALDNPDLKPLWLRSPG